MKKLSILSVMLLTAASCGPRAAGGDGDAGGHDAEVDDDGSLDASPDCPPHEVCGSECCDTTTTCLNGACCPDEAVCGDMCCPAGSLCQAGVCRTDCGGEVPCGDPGWEVCCSGNEVCYQGTCTLPGAPCDDIYDCGGTAYCEPTIGFCLPIPPGGITCKVPTPPPGVFTPQIGWAWTGSTVMPTYNQVMMAPAVANLTDDNSDGVIDEQDIPDVVFHTFAGSNYGADGIMRVVSGDSGIEHWNATAAAARVVPGSSVAIGDIDGDGEPEILTCGTAVGGLHPLLAFEADGTLKWATTDPEIVCGYSGPSIANLDQVGPPEILVRYAVVNADGTLRWRGRPADGLNSVAKFTAFYDVDNDGFLDVVGGNVAYDKDGLELWSRPDHNDGYIAIADLDNDGMPDVVLVDGSEHLVTAFRGDSGLDLWLAPQDVNQGVPTPSGPTGGGPPTVSDFDGDGLPEIAVAGGYGYVVFEGESGDPKWFRQTIDLSSRATGSSVFDFEDDGVAEVLYADERELHIYRGTDGEPLFTMCNSSGTLWEYPLVADVDNDERAEIIVARNNYRFSTCLDSTPAQTGIAVIEDALDNWVRTRRIWNQHTYHVTNVDEDSLIPAIEADNWNIMGLNNYRQNVQPIATPAAPDLIVSSVGGNVSLCPVIAVEAWVENIGDAGAPAGVWVAFYEGDLPAPTFIGAVQTTVPILPGQSLLMSVDWTVPSDRTGEIFTFYAAVDDDGSSLPGEGAGTSDECNEVNNVSPPGEVQCSTVD